jgi:hypothetical protein
MSGCLDKLQEMMKKHWEILIHPESSIPFSTLAQTASYRLAVKHRNRNEQQPTLREGVRWAVHLVLFCGFSSADPMKGIWYCHIRKRTRAPEGDRPLGSRSHLPGVAPASRSAMGSGIREQVHHGTPPQYNPFYDPRGTMHWAGSSSTGQENGRLRECEPEEPDSIDRGNESLMPDFGNESESDAMRMRRSVTGFGMKYERDRRE